MRDKTSFKEKRFTKLWDETLKAQVDAMFALELPLYYGTSAWHNAKCVLDIGCGNGYYLHQLSSKFNNKKYVGIDDSPPLIDVATRRYKRTGIAFHCADIFEHEGQYDFIVARAVVQYLPSLNDFVDKLTQLISPGGAVLIIERDDESPYFFWPDISKLVTLYNSLHVAQDEQKKMSEKMCSQLIQVIKSNHFFGHVTDNRITVPSSIAGNLDKIKKMHDLLIELAHITGGKSSSNIDLIRDEWKQWCRLDHTYADIRLRAIIAQ